MRERLQKKLEDLQDSICKMGEMVEAELKLALTALEQLDVELAAEVYEADRAVNELRFSLEEQCLFLIGTQQPVAGDLRSIVAVMNMIVDLERMGDQAKGIAKVIPHMAPGPGQSHPIELQQMGEMVLLMLRQSLRAYTRNDVELAHEVAQQDDQVDQLCATVFTQVVKQMAATEAVDQVESGYELMRVAQELERFGDLATNIAERVIYRVTGRMQEVNTDGTGPTGLELPAVEETTAQS